MREGMLWFDNMPNRDLLHKILRAAGYYEEKYGQKPSLCFINPSMDIDERRTYVVPLFEDYSDGMWADSILGEASESSAVIEVRLTNSVLPNHFWIGA